MKQNEKKNDEKKKNYLEGSWMGYCPFACVESRYKGVYRDIGPSGAAQRAAGVQGTRPRYGRDRQQHGRMRPRYGLRHGRPAHGACGSACARMG